MTRDVAQAFLPVPMGPAGSQKSMKTRRSSGAMWRGHSCLPRPDSSGRLSGVYSASGGEGVFEAAAPALLPPHFGRLQSGARLASDSGDSPKSGEMSLVPASPGAAASKIHRFERRTGANSAPYLKATEKRRHECPRGRQECLRHVTALALALLLTSCGSTNSTKTTDIALVAKALDSEWWQRVKTGAEEAAKADPTVRLAVLAPEREVNIDQQVSILEDQITKKVAAMAVAPTGTSELIPVLERAHNKAIPVVIFDTDINWPSKISFVGSDNRKAGHLAGEYIAKLLDGKGKVAVIRGILGIATHEDRLAGFQAAIHDSPGIECVAVQPANSERALGMSVMENLVTRYPDLRAVFATNDQMALGAVEAVAARNLLGKVAIVGVDATREGVRAVEAGRLSADVAMYPEMLGRRAVETAIKAARGEPVDQRIDVGEGLVTKENAAQFLK